MVRKIGPHFTHRSASFRSAIYPFIGPQVRILPMGLRIVQTPWKELVDTKYTVSQKRTRDIIDCNFKRINRFYLFWHKYFWHNWPSNDDSSSHLTQHLLSLLQYLGKTEQPKYALKWTTNLNNNWRLDHTKSWSRWSELMKYIVYLLTIVLPTIRSNCWSAKPQGPDFISPDLCPPPTALTSIRSIASSGGHVAAGLSDDVQEWG